MTLQTLGEDEIDTEALQAQIDLSMSFAQDLVTSWIKPSHKLVLNSHKDTERELQEYMRRPPRLGVGAPIPESATLSKETARLKNHLVNKAGNKRAREEEDDVKKQASDDDDDDDDDEDSRARAIRKKVKPDPFGGTGNGSSNGIGKKKKVEPNGIPTLQSTPRPLQGSSPVRAGGSGMEFDDGDEGKGLGPPLIDLKVTSSGLSLSKRKKKNRKKSLPDLAPLLPTLPSSGDRISSNFGVGVIEPIPTTPPKVKQNEFNTPLKSPEVLDISLITTPYALPSPIRRMTASPVSHLKQPLLNLDGPPLAYEDSENDGNHGTPAASPKKKRKRRRKRKTSLVNGTSDGVHQEA